LLRIRGTLLAALVCCTALAAPARADDEVRYQLEIEAPGELGDALRAGLQLERWQTDAQMTPELLRRLADEAVAEATQAAAAYGYFSARVSYTLERDLTPWLIVLHVVPGERTEVAAVQLEFTGPAASDPEAAALIARVRREWLLRPGMPFTQQAWEEAKRDATRRLSSWRYAAARVAASRADVDAEKRAARLSVTLDSGPAFRIGALEVRGNKRYPESVVVNPNPTKPGDTYDRQTLAIYAQRLMQTGYFASARAEVDADASRADAAPVRASVIEGSTQQVETGLSVNTDVGPRLELSYRDVDVRDSAWRWRNALRLDRETQELRTDLDAPPRPGGNWWNSFLAARHTTVQNDETTSTSGGLTYNFPGRASPSSLVVVATFEEERLPDSAPDQRNALFFGARYGFRSTDDLILPRRGYFGNVTAGGAPGQVSTTSFSRFTGTANLLLPLGRSDDLLLRGEGGIVVARRREGIPSQYLFRTGGDQTVRGYAFESIGVQRGDVVLGGRYMALGSVEVTHWMSDAWGLAAFVDAGDAWDSGNFSASVGEGVGARFRTPIGPVRIDVAYGEKVNAWRLHFSVGFVF
jgi:translocation and assembly module TamA